MDEVSEIRARLPIEELVGQYCQLKKKGRTFVTLCPFHNDTHPSLTVSPDKGIAYCFACRTGGDIFSFYQAIEKVDFPQALKDLAERTGVELQDRSPKATLEKDEKARLRACLTEAHRFFQEQLHSSQQAQDYLKKRQIASELIETFTLGYAPDSFSDTYQHLLKQGFSRSEILAAGLGVQKEIREERIYDRFRNRLVFPIFDQRGDLVAFGGRTIGEDDAKYINSSDGPLYSKSLVLFNLQRAKEAARESKRLILVEGYFDVLACHRVGAANVVAVSGTALTEQHVKLLKRYAETVVLCLDQDRAGRDAAERAFLLCAKEGVQVSCVTIEEKDPDEAMKSDPEKLRKTLESGDVPYLDLVLREIGATDLASAPAKHDALRRLLPLLDALPTAVERQHYVARAAAVFATTEAALAQDLDYFTRQNIAPVVSREAAVRPKNGDVFTSMELTLGLFLLYPKLRPLLKELIPPEEGFAAELYGAIKEAPEDAAVTMESLAVDPKWKERVAILQLYCEHHGFGEWAETLAVREIRKNCFQANKEMLTLKQKELSSRILEAHRAGKTLDEAQLTTQYQQVLKLARMAM